MKEGHAPRIQKREVSRSVVGNMAYREYLYLWSWKRTSADIREATSLGLREEIYALRSRGSLYKRMRDLSLRSSQGQSTSSTILINFKPPKMLSFQLVLVALALLPFALANPLLPAFPPLLTRQTGSCQTTPCPVGLCCSQYDYCGTGNSSP